MPAPFMMQKTGMAILYVALFVSLLITLVSLGAGLYALSRAMQAAGF
jgi:hypothetical protein